MISLTRLNDKTIVVNVHNIETAEATPDTVLTLTSGKKLVLKEPIEEVIAKVTQYYRTISQKIVIKDEI